MKRDLPQGDADRVSDIRAAIDKITRYVHGGREAFFRDELVQNSVVLQLLVIGEAASGVSHDLRERHGRVPWRAMIDMRNTMIHGYSYIDLEIVWSVVERDIGPLRAHVEAILEELRAGSS